MDDIPADWAHAALYLLNALDAHIGKEEWDLFPAALGLLSFEGLDFMARVHAEEGERDRDDEMITRAVARP
jgi:hypothetical protein